MGKNIIYNRQSQSLILLKVPRIIYLPDWGALRQVRFKSIQVRNFNFFMLLLS